MRSILSSVVCNKCTARSTRKSWKYVNGDLPSTACRRRPSVRSLLPTERAASLIEKPRASRSLAHCSKRSTIGSACAT